MGVLAAGPLGISSALVAPAPRLALFPILNNCPGTLSEFSTCGYRWSPKVREQKDPEQQKVRRRRGLVIAGEGSCTDLRLVPDVQLSGGDSDLNVVRRVF
eukprot:204883-Rhodomonas_salina.2